MNDVSEEIGVASAVTVDADLLATLNGYRFPYLISNTAPMLGAEYAALVIVEDSGLWFCSRLGFPEAATPRLGALWNAAIAAEGLFVVEDLLTDPRFTDVPNEVGGAQVRLFASCVFHSTDGRPLGLYCIAATEPAELDAAKRDAALSVASHVSRELASIGELDRAGEVQRALLPKKVPPLEGYDVAAVCVPAKAVGGDFYDWYAIDGGMAFTLADVMGRGVAAGIIAATVRATLRTARNDPSILFAIERASRVLAQDLSDAGAFVTLFHARLRASDGHISYGDAGHGLTIVIGSDGTVRRLLSTDLPLGTTIGGDRNGYETTLEMGGTLVSFSDGVLDLYDGTMAAVDRIAELARTASSAREIVDEVERRARRDAGTDDVTVVVIKRPAV